MIKITASVPTYNSELTIKETLESLLNQTYPFEQIKVYDNCSTDRTCEIVQILMKEHNNLILIKNDKNIGAEGNFSRCISEATGDLAILAHADDVYHHDFNKKMVAYFEEHQDVVAAFSAANEINETGEIIGKRFVPHEISSNANTKLSKNEAVTLFYKYGNFVTCPAVVVRSNVYRDKIKNWDGENFKTSADLDVWMRLLDFGKMGFLNDYLINYRVAMASYSFRIAKIRTTKHDIFTVLESEKNKHYALKNKSYLNFLLNKDYAIRFLNTVRKKDKNLISNFSWDVDLNLIDLLRVGFKSIWHLKMLISIFGIRVLYIVRGAL